MGTLHCLQIMKKIILLMLMAFVSQTINAQSSNNNVNISVKDKKDKFLKLFLNQNASYYVEGYDGDELIIEPSYHPITISSPKEAAGLKNISLLVRQPILTISDKLTPVIYERGQTIEVHFAGTSYNSFLVKLPKKMHFGFNFGSTFPNSKLSLKDLTGEVELSGNIPTIEINNISGPLTLIAGGLNLPKRIVITNIIWQKNAKPFYISSLKDDVDISLPKELQTNLTVRILHGSVYSDLKLLSAKPSSDKNIFLGELNGGGIPIYISTDYGDVFVRKQK